MSDLQWYQSPAEIDSHVFIEKLKEFSLPFLLFGFVLSGSIFAASLLRDVIPEFISKYIKFVFPNLNFPNDLKEILNEHQAPLTLSYLLIFYGLVVLVNLSIFGAYKSKPNFLLKYIASPIFLFGFIVGAGMFGAYLGVSLGILLTTDWRGSLVVFIYSITIFSYLILFLLVGKATAQQVWVNYDQVVCRIVALAMIFFIPLINPAWGVIIFAIRRLSESIGG